jgi:hypothetical protein
MTKPNFTSINIVLDRSGSMKKLSADTIGGFNTFLADQKKVKGEAALTLATFSSDYTLVHDFAPLKSITDLTVEKYQPSGYTALLDAIGRTINTTGTKLAAMKEEDRPSQIIFVIITDGEENFSREFTREKVFEMISHQRDKYKWEFLFIGANQDAIQEAAKIGISVGNSLNYVADAGGIASVYGSVSGNMTNYRNTGAQQTDFFNQTSIDTVGNVAVKNTNPITIPTITPASK